MTTKMVFHGSDIEKICAYYHLNKEDIVKFGANVNPLGLSASVKKEIAENIDLFSSYPDRDYVSLRNTIAAYCQIPAEFILPGKWLQRVDLPAYPGACTKAYTDPRTDLFRIFQRTFFLRKHTGILSSTGRT